MIRSITQKKPEEEIERLLKGINRIFIIGCGTCVTLTHTGGEPEVRQLKENLSENPFSDNNDQPFSVGHRMKALSFALEDDSVGIILNVREGKKKGCVPLCEVEVTSKDNDNFWPVREYVVWFANR